MYIAKPRKELWKPGQTCSSNIRIWMSAKNTMPYLKSSFGPGYAVLPPLLSPSIGSAITANPKVWFKNTTELLIQRGQRTWLKIKMYLYAIKQCSFLIKSHSKSIQLEYYYLAEKARLVHTVEGVLTWVKWD